MVKGVLDLCLTVAKDLALVVPSPGTLPPLLVAAVLGPLAFLIEQVSNLTSNSPRGVLEASLSDLAVECSQVEALLDDKIPILGCKAGSLGRRLRARLNAEEHWDDDSAPLLEEHGTTPPPTSACYGGSWGGHSGAGWGHAGAEPAWQPTGAEMTSAPSYSSYGSAAAHARPPPAAPPSRAASSFEAIHDPSSGSTYYANAATGETSWQRPCGDESRSHDLWVGPLRLLALPVLSLTQRSMDRYSSPQGLGGALRRRVPPRVLLQPRDRRQRVAAAGRNLLPAAELSADRGRRRGVAAWRAAGFVVDDESDLASAIRAARVLADDESGFASAVASARLGEQKPPKSQSDAEAGGGAAPSAERCRSKCQAASVAAATQATLAAVTQAWHGLTVAEACGVAGRAQPPTEGEGYSDGPQQAIVQQQPSIVQQPVSVREYREAAGIPQGPRASAQG